MSISVTAASAAERLVEYAAVDQRAVMVELKARGKARMKDLDRVVPDRQRLKSALMGLRGQGYVEYKHPMGVATGYYLIADNCAEGYSDVIDDVSDTEEQPIRPSLTINPTGSPRGPRRPADQPDETMRDYYEAKLDWYAKEVAAKDKEIASLTKSVNNYRVEAERLRNHSGVRRSAYEILLDIANDPDKPDMVRIKAASEAAQYDKPKLSASINRNENISNIGDEMDRARDRMGLIEGPG